jgi:hypothetical protein
MRFMQVFLRRSDLEHRLFLGQAAQLVQRRNNARQCGGMHFVTCYCHGRVKGVLRGVDPNGKRLQDRGVSVQSKRVLFKLRIGISAS